MSPIDWTVIVGIVALLFGGCVGAVIGYLVAVMDIRHTPVTVQPDQADDDEHGAYDIASGTKLW
jgi:uncharacterized membrane protein